MCTCTVKSYACRRAFVKSFVSRLEEVRRYLESAQQRTAEDDSQGKVAVTFAPGQLVMLSTKNLRVSVEG